MKKLVLTLAVVIATLSFTPAVDAKSNASWNAYILDMCQNMYGMGSGVNSVKGGWDVTYPPATNECITRWKGRFSASVSNTPTSEDIKVQIINLTNQLVNLLRK